MEMMHNITEKKNLSQVVMTVVCNLFFVFQIFIYRNRIFGHIIVNNKLMDIFIFFDLFFVFVCFWHTDSDKLYEHKRIIH
mgnify:CR=1 FL=1